MFKIIVEKAQFYLGIICTRAKLCHIKGRIQAESSKIDGRCLRTGSWGEIFGKRREEGKRSCRKLHNIFILPNSTRIFKSKGII
jgi:hypothetical protein